MLVQRCIDRVRFANGAGMLTFDITCCGSSGPRSQPSFRAGNNWMAGFGPAKRLQWPDLRFIGVHCFSRSVMCMGDLWVGAM